MSIPNGDTDNRVRYEWDDMIGDVFDLLAECGERGADLADVVALLGVPQHVARQVVNKLRSELEGGTVGNVIVRSDGRGRRYVLTTESPKDWLDFHAKYTRSRLSSVLSVYSSIAKSAADEEAKHDAERIARMVARLVEDIEEIERRHAQPKAHRPLIPTDED